MLVDDLKEYCRRCAGGETAEFPGVCATEANFDLGNAGVFFIGRHAGPYGSGDLEFAGALDFKSSVEGHSELILGVFGKHSLESLLEERRVERVAHHHMATVTEIWAIIISKTL
jgi:hypothetical protein